MLIVSVVVFFAATTGALFVISRFCHRAIVETFVTGRHPLSLTVASRCRVALTPAIYHLHLGCTFLFLFLFWGDRNLEQDSCTY